MFRNFHCLIVGESTCDDAGMFLLGRTDTALWIALGFSAMLSMSSRPWYGRDVREGMEVILPERQSAFTLRCNILPWDTACLIAPHTK